MKLCVIEDCGKPAPKRRMCSMHYGRLWRHGDPFYKVYASKGEPLEWVTLLVNEVPDDTCREWPFHRSTSEGRPNMFHQGRSTIVARVILELSGLERPGDNFFALHSCDNGNCCAPWHLRWGTLQENSDDMIGRGRHYANKYEKLIAWLDEHGIEFPKEMR